MCYDVYMTSRNIFTGLATPREGVYPHVLLHSPLITQQLYSLQLSSSNSAQGSPELTTAWHPYMYNSQQADDLLKYLKTELPTLLGQHFDEKLSAQVRSIVEGVGEITAKQNTEIKTELGTAKDELMAKKSSSIVTLNGSIFGFGKFTEAWTKTIEAIQAVGKTWSGATNAASNVDNVSFPRQLGRSMLNGGKGAMKLTAGGLGAAIVMSALLATTGIALNKVHDSYPSVPSVASIAAKVTGQAEKLKVTVGSVEIERAGGSEAKVMSMQERAAGLLAHYGNDYGRTIASVDTALSLSLIDGKSDAVQSNTQLIKELRTMQAAQAQAPVVSAGATAPTATSGPTM